MANRERGETSLEIEGVSYTFCMDLDAQCALEEMFSTPTREVLFQDVLAKVNAGSARHIRAILWAGLQKYHKDLTLAMVSDIVQGAGGLENFAAKVLRQFGTAITPDPEDLKVLGINPNGNPQKAQVTRRAGGTGKRSTATRGASV